MPKSLVYLPNTSSQLILFPPLKVSIAVTLDAGSQTSGISAISDEMIAELREFCHVQIESGLSLVAIIGNEMSKTAGTATKAFDAIERFAVRMICYGASSHNLCFLVDENNANDALIELHKFLLE